MTTVRELRNRTGLTQKEFSDKYNIPFGTIAEWDFGRTKPKTYVLNLLERFVMEDEIVDFKKPIIYGVNFGRLLDISGLNKTDFGRKYNITIKTAQNWSLDKNDWKIRLLERAVREDKALGK